jgi:N-acetyl sugar amidotransferase
MDSTAKNIFFDENGYCNFCNDFIVRSENLIKVNTSLHKFIEQIKKDGKGKDYDCIIGISGGIDSSYVLVKAIELGLRPLAVHMDNGWNSELAQNNIYNIINKLNIDLYTHVIEWEEYRKLMNAFFDSDVIDVELLYDNAMTAVNYNLASRYGIKYILSGSNNATEGMIMPQGWNWFKFDFLNIKDIASKHGNVSIKTFPHINTIKKLYFNVFKKIRWVPFLDYFDYNKDLATELLEKNYNYKKYPFKHYESIFTRFYQGYILPLKFNIDKRKLHLSTLIISKQLSRDQALTIINTSPYPTNIELSEDIDYFLKKMKWDRTKLQDYINRSEKSHLSYKSEIKLYNIFYKNKNNILYNLLYKIYKNIVIK